MRGRYEYYLFWAHNGYSYCMICFCENCHRSILGDGYPSFCDVCWG